MPTVRFQVPAEFKGWQMKFQGLVSELKAQDELWTAAGEVYFAHTQRLSHVISGDMRASGRLESETGDAEVAAIVTYGNETVDYAGYEQARGGSHDYLGRAWEASEATLRDAISQMWSAVWTG